MTLGWEASVKSPKYRLQIQPGHYTIRVGTINFSTLDQFSTMRLRQMIHYGGSYVFGNTRRDPVRHEPPIAGQLQV